MHKLLISLPEDLACRFRAAVPTKQRSQVIISLLEKELQRKERLLYETAKAVEKDDALNQDMAAWDTTISDGLDHEAW